MSRIHRIGVYAIRHVKSGRRYIGGSTDIVSRYTFHRFGLRRGTHKNKNLQVAWDRYGEAAFVFEIAELCSKAQLEARETYWIESSQQPYNILAALILRAFVGSPGEGQYLARHLDDDRSNNKLPNLAWGNDADNRIDAIRNGRSFVSYGHLGKPHSEKTKQLLRKQRLDKPTGHRMAPEHKTAIWEGYRRKFPVKTSSLCSCGCGILTKPGNRFIRGHAGRLKFQEIAQERIGRPREW